MSLFSQTGMHRTAQLGPVAAPAFWGALGCARRAQGLTATNHSHPHWDWEQTHLLRQKSHLQSWMYSTAQPSPGQIFWKTELKHGFILWGVLLQFLGLL